MTAGFTKGVTKRFTLPEIDWTKSGAAQNAEALADGTTFNRIEDGALRPAQPERLLLPHHRGRRHGPG